MRPSRLASRIFASHVLVVLVALVLGVWLFDSTAGRVLVVAVAIAVAGLLSGVLARSITVPIARLVRSVRRMTDGEPEPTGEPGRPGPEELAELAAALSASAEELRSRVDEIAGERDRAGQILAALENGVLVLDEHGGLGYANPAARAWFALDEFEPGTPAQRVLGVFEITRLAKQAVASGRRSSGQVTLVFPEHRTLAVRVTPLSGRDGSSGTLVTLVDLTGRRRLEVLRRDFVANASHELKTPVAAIRVLAESLEDALDDEDRGTARRFVGRIGEEAERLGRLVKDLLDLSRVERGTLAIEPVDMVALVKDVTGRSARQAAERQLDLRTDLQPGVAVRGDRAQLALLVSNLVENAIQYTQPGGQVRVDLRAEGSGGARIVVADTGMGIPSGQLPRIFERFYRIDKARDRQTGGTGLGLAIVRHVAESHGGRVAVDSELGRGSTFTATLPASPPAAAT
jgi:two-component system phosphate regulon sensor histidine kinase PhoR